MKLLLARELTGSFFFRVLLDESKVDADGTPDPDYVAEYEWARQPPDGRTRAGYLGDVKRELKLLAAEALAQRTGAARGSGRGSGTALPGLEGQPL